MRTQGGGKTRALTAFTISIRRTGGASTMYQTSTTLRAGRSAMLSRLVWLVIIAAVVFGAVQLTSFLFSFVDPSRYDEIWYLAWL
jgi:hypothetical protein